MALRAFNLIDKNDLAQVELATWLDYGEGKEMEMTDEAFDKELKEFVDTARRLLEAKGTA